MKQEKVHVYIGRFQIPHIGHEATIKDALSKTDNLVILVGSSELARDPKNPFTFEERFKVLDGICSRLVQHEYSLGRKVRYNILPIHDHVYNNQKWLGEVQTAVSSVTKSTDITLCGYNKDDSSFYLNFFNHWKKDFIDVVKGTTQAGNNIPCMINSSDLRTQLFETNSQLHNIPPETIEFLDKFNITNKSTLTLLRDEHKFVKDYRAKMKSTLPYDNIPFLTGDALVTCCGHILLVKRKTFPGKGLYALPGGFFDAWEDKDQVETALRELREETKIKVPYKVLKGNIDSVIEFGDFNRSLRWRIITKCVYIKLDDVTLPKVKGADDAEKAFWVPFNEILKNRDMFFEDHLSIIDTFLNL